MIIVAVNGCIRDWAANLGVYGQEKIVLADRKFYYAVQASFIEDGTRMKPFRVWGISADGGSLYGLDRAEKPSQMGNSSPMGPFPLYWDLVDDQFWVNQVKNLDTIFVHGPLEGLSMTDGADTTNVLPADRSAVCDCATARVLDQIEGVGAGDVWWKRFEAHMIARGGTVPQRVP